MVGIWVAGLESGSEGTPERELVTDLERWIPL